MPVSCWSVTGPPAGSAVHDRRLPAQPDRAKADRCLPAPPCASSTATSARDARRRQHCDAGGLARSETARATGARILVRVAVPAMTSSAQPPTAMSCRYTVERSTSREWSFTSFLVSSSTALMMLTFSNAPLPLSVMAARTKNACVLVGSGRPLALPNLDNPYQIALGALWAYTDKVVCVHKSLGNP